MPPRRVDAIIRSGRFKFTNPVTPVTIISNRTDTAKDAALYRIFNTGETSLVVSSVPGGPLTVLKGCTLDCGPVDTAKIGNAAAMENVEGIYDTVALVPEVRSGKFEVPASATVNLVVIAKLTVQDKKPVYRIYNTGEAAFNVVVGTAAPLPVAIESSLDIELKPEPGPGPTILKITAGTASVQGVYELLSLKLP